MIKRCPEPHCYAPEVACHLGEANLPDCPHWKDATTAETDRPQGAADVGSMLLPWSANSFGVVDLPFIAARSNPIVVGVIGPQGAGKTTLLAAWYLILGRGARLADSLFAGSYTLGGWENIAHSLRWTEANGPTFPMHTPTAGRVPGLLHLAFRDTSGQLRDFIFTDASGEWFRRWATDRDAEDAVGARWISENADLFLVLADCDSLQGPSRGVARHELELLLERLGNERRDRPVALVWSKADLAVPNAIQVAVRKAAALAAPGFSELSVSVYPENDVEQTTRRYLELLLWAVTRPQHRVHLEMRNTETDDFFLGYER
jgi:hypothetical protein